jgi:hypothetical protein
MGTVLWSRTWEMVPNLDTVRRGEVVSVKLLTIHPGDIEPSDVKLSQSPSRHRDVSQYNPLSLSLSEWSSHKPSRQSLSEKRFVMLTIALIVTLRFRYFHCFRRLQKLFLWLFKKFVLMSRWHRINCSVYLASNEKSRYFECWTKIWEKGVVACFKALSWNSHEGTEKVIK